MQIRQDVRNRKIIFASASLRGSRFLKTSSCTQAIVAQWSAEAELHAVVSGATEELGMVSLLSGFGLLSEIQKNMGTAAAWQGLVESAPY